MYDIIYDQMVEAHVAVACDSPVFCNKHGNIVSEDKKYGKANTIKITHPNYIVFADETGCNTSMKKNGHIAGTKYLVKK